MKEIQYRGGLAVFSIPANWVEELDPNSGGTYYLDEPDSGTLRLTVQTFQKAGHDQSLTSTDALSGSQSKYCTTVQELPNGNSICEYIIRTEEEGEKITLYWWQVANVVPKNTLRIASFSYTVLSSQEGNSRVTAELKLLRSSIEAVRFSKEIGL